MSLSIFISFTPLLITPYNILIRVSQIHYAKEWILNHIPTFWIWHEKYLYSSFSSPYFPAFGLNTEIYSVFIGINNFFTPFKDHKVYTIRWQYPIFVSKKENITFLLLFFCLFVFLARHSRTSTVFSCEFCKILKGTVMQIEKALIL